MANRWGNSDRLYFLRLQNHCRWWLQPWNERTLASWKKSYDKPRQHIKKQRHYFTNKGPSSQRYGFSSSHVWMWELDCEESWAPKNCCFWTVVLEKTLESPLHCKEIQLVHPKGNQSWIFIERTDAEAETPILWPPDAKNWLTGKDPDAGKDWRHEEKETTEDWKVVAEPQKRPGFLASRGEEFNPGPETRLDRSELLCNRVLLKYKKDRECFWHRRGQKEYPLASVSNGVIYF